MNSNNLRPHTARHLQQRLHAFADGFKQNLALIGPPGSGKTFQLQAVLGQPTERLTVVYCPIYREASRSFLTRFLCAILRAGSPVAVESDDQSLEGWLRRAEAGIPRVVAAIRGVEGVLSRRLFAEAFTRALDVIPILVEERGRPCVLMLDEFLSLEEIGLSHAFHELGKRVMTWPSTLFVLTSSSPNRARVILRERLQLLFGQFELLSIEGLDTPHVTAWVHQELRGLRGSARVTPFLIRWLGGSPWYLTVFLKRLRELAALERAGGLDEALFLNTAWDILGSPAGILHQWCATRVEGLVQAKLGPRAMEALIHIAQGARTMTDLGKRIGRAGLSSAVEMLVERDLAQRNGMCWLVPDPVLRTWLSTVLANRRAEGRLEEAELRGRFDAHLKTLWARWERTQQLSLTRQVAELFERFDEETVALDCKTGRLPRFDHVRTQQPGHAGVESYMVADGKGRRWCATVQQGPVEENAIAQFDAFCRGQQPRPSRKVVITRVPLDENTKVVAKTANMWVWESQDVDLLAELYGQL